MENLLADWFELFFCKLRVVPTHLTVPDEGSQTAGINMDDKRLDNTNCIFYITYVCVSYSMCTDLFCHVLCRTCLFAISVNVFEFLEKSHFVN